MIFKEIEFKYDAKEIDMQKFMDYMETLSPKKKMLVSSYDDYFTDPNGNFIRYRYTDGRGELTIKRKLNDKNNNERIEVNLETTGDNFKSVEAFVNLLNYQHNFGIYKTCKIYWIDNVVAVYYIVYNKKMEEVRRFVEIEANEDLQWESEEQALNAVIHYEKLLEPVIGITSRNRLRKSLFEMFRKDSPKSSSV